MEETTETSASPMQFTESPLGYISNSLKSKKTSDTTVSTKKMCSSPKVFFHVFFSKLGLTKAPLGGGGALLKVDSSF